MTATFKPGDVIVRTKPALDHDAGEIVEVASLEEGDGNRLLLEGHGPLVYSSTAFRHLEKGETLRLAEAGRELYADTLWDTPLVFEKVDAGFLCVRTGGGTPGRFRPSGRLVASPEPEYTSEGKTFKAGDRIVVTDHPFDDGPERNGAVLTIDHIETGWAFERFDHDHTEAEPEGSEPGMFDAEPIYNPYDEVPTPAMVIRARNFADQFSQGREPGEFFDYLTENDYLTDQAYRDMSESLDQ